MLRDSLEDVAEEWLTLHSESLSPPSLQFPSIARSSRRESGLSIRRSFPVDDGAPDLVFCVISRGLDCYEVAYDVSDCAGRKAAALSALWEMRRIWQAASTILGHLNAADSLPHLVGLVPERLRENRVKVPTRLLVGAMVLICVADASTTRSTQAADEKSLELGNFSVSLAVKDIKASMAFYQKLDFKQVGGNLEQNWVVLQNGTARIGLFQGMFEKNILTFNPGWTKNKETLTDFQDVRELQRALKARGLTIAPEADVTTKGPAYFEVADPDGNTLLIDQHVPSPSR